MCFTLGFYEALLGLLNPVDKFTISLGSIWIYDDSLFFVNNTVPCFIPYRPCIFPLPASLLSYYFNKKKQQEQVTKKFSEWKQAHVGMEPSKTSRTRWEHHNTSTPSLHLVPFANYAQQKSLHTHRKWTRHSALLTPQLSTSKTIHICHIQHH